MVVSGHGKKYDLLPVVFVGGSVGAWQEVRFVASSFCCVGAWQEVRFVASSFCGSVRAWQELRFITSSFCGCVAAWQEVRFVASSFLVLWGHGRSTVCCL